MLKVKEADELAKKVKDAGDRNALRLLQKARLMAGFALPI